MSRSVANSFSKTLSRLQPVRGNRLAKKLISLAAARSFAGRRVGRLRGKCNHGVRRLSGKATCVRAVFVAQGRRSFLPLIHFALATLMFIHHDLAIALDLYPTVHAGRIRFNLAPRSRLKNPL